MPIVIEWAEENIMAVDGMAKIDKKREPDTRHPRHSASESVAKCSDFGRHNVGSHKAQP